MASVAIFALSACSDKGPEGTTIGNETTTAEATPDTPSPTATKSNATPDEKKGSSSEKLDAADKAKVEGTVGAYLQALNNAYKTGKTAEVRKLTHDKCGFCGQVLGYIDDVYRKGGRIEGCQVGTPEGVTVGNLYTLAGTVRQVPYSAKVSATECKTLNKSGGVVGRDPAGVQNVQFTLEQAGQEWKVRTWELR
ncbi:hypothetical protein GCM10027569_02210 [Flindersiella endophytica]